jgi:light-regulated signal transduction histidine kinase (bacteriophytochrome)
LDENGQKYSGFVSEGVSRMNNLLDALLQYATIGKEEEEKEMIDMNDIIDDVIFNLKLLIRETSAQIEFSGLPSMRVLPSRMVHLFQNLIGNAIKFRNGETAPHIKIEATESSSNVIFTVSDNGIGIENEHIDRIFVIFQRLHTRKQYEGTGIGLAICQKIVLGMGGRIWVQSKVGEGSSFHFSIPKEIQTIDTE